MVAYLIAGRSIKMMPYFLLFFLFCLRALPALAQQAASPESVKNFYSTGLDSYHAEIALFPEGSTPELQKKKSIEVLFTQYQKGLSKGVAEDSFTNEMISHGNCKLIAKKSKVPCRIMLFGHRDYIIKTKDLHAIVDQYTTDLQNPLDKSTKLHHFKIDRFHWLFEKTEAHQINDISQITPLKMDQPIILKKCRYGGLIGWQCNNIAYSLVKINDSTFAIMGKQLSPTESIQSYRAPAAIGPSSNNEKIQFKKSQLKNSADGTISMTVIRQNSVKDSIFVREMTLSSFSQPDEAHKIFASKKFLDQGLKFEFDLLKSKFQKNLHN